VWVEVLHEDKGTARGELTGPLTKSSATARGGTSRLRRTCNFSIS
jgi:hypothetical protein